MTTRNSKSTETYTEQKNAMPFDWPAFLNRDDQTDDEMYDAAVLARKWVTRGDLSEDIQRDNVGRPTDPALLDLGIAFFEAVEYGYVYRHDRDRHLAKARRVLVEIEQRCAELIRKK